MIASNRVVDIAEGFGMIGSLMVVQAPKLIAAREATSQERRRENVEGRS